jgi:hypothetical protein
MICMMGFLAHSHSVLQLRANVGDLDKCLVHRSAVMIDTCLQVVMKFIFLLLLYNAYAGHVTDYYAAWTNNVAAIEAITCVLMIHPGGSHMTPPVSL